MRHMSHSGVLIAQLRQQNLHLSFNYLENITAWKYDTDIHIVTWFHDIVGANYINCCLLHYDSREINFSPLLITQNVVINVICEYAAVYEVDRLCVYYLHSSRAYQILSCASHSLILFFCWVENFPNCFSIARASGQRRLRRGGRSALGCEAGQQSSNIASL